jgi:aryl-alcohol dehydrogenase-like predicted oxidoreductase
MQGDRTLTAEIPSDLTRLAIGTAQFGLNYGVANMTGQVTIADIADILALARKSGVDTLDTAISYGASEANLGSLGVSDFALVTKLPPLPNGDLDIDRWAVSCLAGSLSRLKTKRIRSLLLHKADDLMSDSGPELYRTLKNLKQTEEVETIGISVYSPESAIQLCERFELDIVQIPFNVFDRRLISTGTMDKLTKFGVEIHTRSIFLQGLLLMPEDAVPSQFLHWQDLFLRWHTWLKENKISALEACLGFVKNIQSIAKIIVGIDGIIQFNEIIAAFRNNNMREIPESLASADENLIIPSNWIK